MLILVGEGLVGRQIRDVQGRLIQIIIQGCFLNCGCFNLFFQDWESIWKGRREELEGCQLQGRVRLLFFVDFFFWQYVLYMIENSICNMCCIICCFVYWIVGFFRIGMMLYLFLYRQCLIYFLVYRICIINFC